MLQISCNVRRAHAAQALARMALSFDPELRPTFKQLNVELSQVYRQMQAQVGGRTGGRAGGRAHSCAGAGQVGVRLSAGACGWVCAQLQAAGPGAGAAAGTGAGARACAGWLCAHARALRGAQLGPRPLIVVRGPAAPLPRTPQGAGPAQGVMASLTRQLAHSWAGVLQGVYGLGLGQCSVAGASGSG